MNEQEEKTQIETPKINKKYIIKALDWILMTILIISIIMLIQAKNTAINEMCIGRPITTGIECLNQTNTTTCEVCTLVNKQRGTQWTPTMIQ